MTRVPAAVVLGWLAGFAAPGVQSPSPAGAPPPSLVCESGPWSVTVAADGRSGEVKQNGRAVTFGTMKCDGDPGSKDRTCWSTGVADAGYRVVFFDYARTGAVQLQTESIAGPHPVASLPCRTSGTGAPQSRPADAGDWTLEYVVAGGIAFNVHSVKVTKSGALAASDRRLGMDVDGRAPGDLIARLDAWVKTAGPAKKTPISPDQIAASLTVTSAGRAQELEPAADVTRALDAAWTSAVEGAIVGVWTQSDWKLCTPASKITSADMDAPIDDLVFRADGTFSVTWRGGGARTTSVPPDVVPDYGGRYTLDAARGGIHLLVGSASPPRDFTSDGTFRLAHNQLTLKEAWLGTRVARQKPDICELTFSRKSNP